MMENANAIVSMNYPPVSVSIDKRGHLQTHRELALELGLVAELREEDVVRMAELGEVGMVVVGVPVNGDGR